MKPEGRRQLWCARAESILEKLYRERGLQGLRPHPAVRVCRAGTPLSELSYRYPTPSLFSVQPDTLRVRRAKGHILNLVHFVFSTQYDLWRVTRSSSSGTFLCALADALSFPTSTALTKTYTQQLHISRHKSTGARGQKSKFVGLQMRMLLFFPKI